VTGGQAYDIAVIGAGPAGIAAAVAGATAGAKVLLVEAGDRLGGTVTEGMHRSLCGLYAHAPSNPWDTLNAGVQRDVTTQMARHDPDYVRVRQFGKTWVLEFPTSTWESVLAKMCESPGLEVRLRTRLVGVDQDGSRMTTVRLNGAGPEYARAKVFVDCTGEGALIRMADADMVTSAQERENPWLAGYALRLAGLTDDLEMLRLRIPYALAQAVAVGSLPPEARFTMFHPGPLAGEGVCKLAVPSALGGVRQDDLGDEITSGNPLLDEYVDNVVGILVREIPACSHAHIVERSRRPLARDGVRLRGRRVVTQEDVLGGCGGNSPAVQAWWPMEIWEADRGPVFAYPPIGRSYAIPDEALQSDRFDNLLAAGACVSATRDARASLRAGGICLATGDAAGRLAARL